MTGISLLPGYGAADGPFAALVEAEPVFVRGQPTRQRARHDIAGLTALSNSLLACSRDPGLTELQKSVLLSAADVCDYVADLRTKLVNSVVGRDAAAAVAEVRRALELPGVPPQTDRP